MSDPARRDWQPVDLVNRSFGQGVAVTQVQLATAFSAFVNGGNRVHPRLVAGVGGQPAAVQAPVPALEPQVERRQHEQRHDELDPEVVRVAGERVRPEDARALDRANGNLYLRRHR